MQVLWSCVDVDTSLFLSFPEIPTNCIENSRDHKSIVHSNPKTRGRATIPHLIESSCAQGYGTDEALEVRSMNAKKAFMQATMLKAFQAHQNIQHPSRISVLSFGDKGEGLLGQASLEEKFSAVTQQGLHDNCQKTSDYHTSVIAMHKTLYMENRATCGPAIHCWGPPPHIDVCT